MSRTGWVLTPGSLLRRGTPGQVCDELRNDGPGYHDAAPQHHGPQVATDLYRRNEEGCDDECADNKREQGDDQNDAGNRDGKSTDNGGG